MLSRQEFIRFALVSISERGVPAPEQIESQISELLVLAPHLAGERQSLVDDVLTAIVTSVGKAETLVDSDEIGPPWITPQIKAKWVHWPWLQAYLAAEVKRPLRVMKELDFSTDEVIDMIGDPKRDGIWDRRGLVVGHVQSGKTQHYTAVAAKALDAGFKLVIILSGIHENLRQQTQERVEEVLIGKDSRREFAHCGIRLWSNRRLARIRIPGDPIAPLPDIITQTSVAGDFGAVVNRGQHVTPGQVPVIMVVKKNASILDNLLRWVKNANDGAALDFPALVIDDEADHSSINTAATDPETNPTRINNLIRKIIWRLNRVAYLGYTATPYANIFMDPAPVPKSATRNLDDRGADIFPKTFITTLKAPTNYLGPEEVFGRASDESLEIAGIQPLPMHREVDDADSWMPPRHRKTLIVSPDMPNSLQEAIRAFLLTVAARMALGHGGEHMSMLVHVSRFTAVQEQVVKHIENDLSSLIERLRHGESADDEWAALEELWRRVFEGPFASFVTHPSQQLVKPKLPEWGSIKALVFEAFGRIVFRNINSSSKQNLDYSGAKDGLVVVAVGGDRLSRGLTLSGLSVSYFLRGARAFDTLMQMGRWFGYRPAYAHLCRVYAPGQIVENFAKIALATEELRREFSRMCYLKKRPTEYGLRVREPRIDMLVTAMNKMRRGETVRVHFAESFVSSLDIPKNAADANFKAFSVLMSEMEKRHGGEVAATQLMKSGEKGSHHHRWEAVDGKLVLEFLKTYRASANICFAADTNGSTQIARYVQTMLDKGELDKWTVALVTNSRSDEVAILGKKYRRLYRKIDAGKAKARRDQYTFQGVAMGQDEAIDLSSEEYNKAIAQSAGDKRSKAAFYRMNRPPERGLLLLYPISPEKEGTALELDDPLIGVAVSFPKSDNDAGQEYVCNPRMLVELFGEPFAEDAIRDEEEDREAVQASGGAA
jgi:hypothetical protein